MTLRYTTVVILPTARAVEESTRGTVIYLLTLLRGVEYSGIPRTQPLVTNSTPHFCMWMHPGMTMDTSDVISQMSDTLNSLSL